MPRERAEVAVVSITEPVENGGEYLLESIGYLKAHGISVVMGEHTLGQRDSRTSGTYQERCSDLHWAATAGKWVWPLKGGYAVHDLLPQLAVIGWEIAEAGGVVIGNSDPELLNLMICVQSINAGDDLDKLIGVYGVNFEQLKRWGPKTRGRMLNLIQTGFCPELNDAQRWRLLTPYKGPIDISGLGFPGGIAQIEDVLAMKPIKLSGRKIILFIEDNNEWWSDHFRKLGVVILGNDEIRENLAGLAIGNRTDMKNGDYDGLYKTKEARNREYLEIISHLGREIPVWETGEFGHVLDDRINAEMFPIGMTNLRIRYTPQNGISLQYTHQHRRDIYGSI